MSGIQSVCASWDRFLRQKGTWDKREDGTEVRLPAGGAHALPLDQQHTGHEAVEFRACMVEERAGLVSASLLGENLLHNPCAVDSATRAETGHDDRRSPPENDRHATQ